ncbi:hypothetical protein TNCV_2190861 [Trichonephila clavipes]|uniref:Uncharacterized protein n=1 Tax=Trichonephila clavipes TaxID=2585209 RepID=A0A8X6RCE5_TRICX|nr:hypothetical protein TNCV_2190861 [Trichonephila clavipes]
MGYTPGSPKNLSCRESDLKSSCWLEMNHTLVTVIRLDPKKSLGGSFPIRKKPLKETRNDYPKICSKLFLSRSVESDLRVSLVNNGLVGPYSATVLVTLPSAPDHRPPRLESAR